jgi:hypothetical protein
VTAERAKENIRELDKIRLSRVQGSGQSDYPARVLAKSALVCPVEEKLHTPQHIISGEEAPVRIDRPALGVPGVGQT